MTKPGIFRDTIQGLAPFAARLEFGRIPMPAQLVQRILGRAVPVPDLGGHSVRRQTRGLAKGYLGLIHRECKERPKGSAFERGEGIFHYNTQLDE